MDEGLIKKIVLGTAQFGMAYGIANAKGQVPEGEVSKILKLAYAKGIKRLDTASAYGQSEEVIGRCLERLRLRFNIVSKLSKVADVRGAFNASLKRLRVNKLQGCLIHSIEELKADPSLWKSLQK